MKITAEDLNKFADTPEADIFMNELIELINAQTDAGILCRAYVLQGLLIKYNKENK